MALRDRGRALYVLGGEIQGVLRRLVPFYGNELSSGIKLTGDRRAELRLPPWIISECILFPRPSSVKIGSTNATRPRANFAGIANEERTRADEQINAYYNLKLCKYRLSFAPRISSSRRLRTNAFQTLTVIRLRTDI